jgi:hypothetical protein
MSKPTLWLAAEIETSIENLGRWIEALGGELRAHAKANIEGEPPTANGKFAAG